MKTSRSKIASVVAEMSLKNAGTKKLADDVAAYLLTERRTGELDSLLRDVMQYRADHGIVEVTAVSSHELNPALTKEIEAKVKQLYPGAKQIIISPVLDHDVIGGVRLEFANEQLDLSVRSKLNQFKQLTAA